jgi:hypothetical protein|tara:strand:- start:1187 stop:1498 length:312 start_codon:yes stop_codon:yes gene_type:complete
MPLKLEVRAVVAEEHARVPHGDDSIAHGAANLHVGVAVGLDPQVIPDASQVASAVPQTFGVDRIARGFLVGHQGPVEPAPPRAALWWPVPSFADFVIVTSEMI